MGHSGNRHARWITGFPFEGTVFPCILRLFRLNFLSDLPFPCGRSTSHAGVPKNTVPAMRLHPIPKAP
jgi:hypothetical protein